MESYKKFFIKISLMIFPIFLFSFCFFIFHSGGETKAQTIILAADNTMTTNNNTTTGANSSEGQQPAGTIAQVLSNWYPIVLSFVISILAITIPWSMAGELVNLLKSGWGKLKGHTMGALQKTGTQTMAKEAWYKVRATGIGQQTAARWRQYFGRGKRAEAALQKQNEDIEKLSVEMMYNDALKKYGREKVPKYIMDAVKRVGGADLVDVASAATMETDVLVDKFRRAGGIDALMGRPADATKAKDRRESLGAIVRQLSDPYKRDAAMKRLSEIANDSGLTLDQVITTDLRTFEPGNPMSRPGQAVVDIPDRAEKQGVQTDITRLRQEAKSFNLTAEGISALDDIRGAIDTYANADAERSAISANRLADHFRELITSGRARDENDASRQIRGQLDSARILIEQNTEDSIQQAASILNQLKIPVSPMERSQERIQRLTTQAERWNNEYQSRRQAGATHEVASRQADSAVRTTIKLESYNEQVAKVVSRVTGVTIGADHVQSIREGSALPTDAPLAKLMADPKTRRQGEQTQAFVRQMLGRLPLPQPTPEQIETGPPSPPTSREEFYQQQEQGRRGYGPPTNR